jgi:DNA-binding response OmpR family regulator
VRKKTAQSVLLLEDDDQLRQMLRLTLIYSGYEVLEASSPNEVAAVYEQHRPDLVIIDLVVVDLTMSLEALLEVIMGLRRGDERARILTITNTGLVDPERYLLFAREICTYHTLTKPFSISRFLEAVRLALASKA